MLEFLGYTFLEDQIVGVGPLMQRHSSDIAVKQVYNPIQLFFKLILKSTSVTIESDWFNCYGPDAEKEQRREGLKKLQEEYRVAILNIKEVLIKNKNYELN